MKQCVIRFHEGRSIYDETMDTKINRYINEHPELVIKNISLTEGRNGLEAVVLFEIEEEA